MYFGDTTLVEVKVAADRLLERVNNSLGRTLAPLSIEIPYSDSRSFEAMKGIQEIEGDKDHYVVVTGVMTHYLRSELRVPNCRYHDIALAREDQLDESRWMNFRSKRTIEYSNGTSSSVK